MKEFTCKKCSEKFYLKDIPTNENKKFCSKSCANSFNVPLRKEKNFDKFYSTINCSQCKKEFDKLKSRIGANNFCCNDCYLEFHKTIYKAYNCKTCNKKIRIPQSSKYVPQFCSPKCFSESDQNKRSAKYKRGKYYSRKTKLYFDYASSWELRRMKSLDLDKSVIKWFRCTDKIPYIDFNGINRRYFPDLEIYYINGDIIIEEIKGLFDENTLIKKEAAINFYEKQGKQYRIINDQILKSFDSNGIEVYYNTYSNDYGVWVRPRLEYVFMNLAKHIEQLSTCIRNKVGAVFVDERQEQVLAFGYNGDESGGPNQCESLESGKCNCIHAEANAMTKNTGTLEGSTLYVTLSPCRVCAKMLINRRIKRIVYLRAYRDTGSFKLLREHGIIVTNYRDLGDHFFEHGSEMPKYVKNMSMCECCKLTYEEVLQLEK